MKGQFEAFCFSLDIPEEIQPLYQWYAQHYCWNCEYMQTGFYSFGTVQCLLCGFKRTLSESMRITNPDMMGAK